jgi:microcystin-dependent protein
MLPFVGQVEAFAFNFAPQGWAPCDGRLLQIAANTALFSLIGMTYGGDGKSTFALPKLAPVAPGGPNFFIALNGTFPPK